MCCVLCVVCCVLCVVVCVSSDGGVLVCVVGVVWLVVCSGEISLAFVNVLLTKKFGGSCTHAHTHSANLCKGKVPKFTCIC